MLGVVCCLVVFLAEVIRERQLVVDMSLSSVVALLFMTIILLLCGVIKIAAVKCFRRKSGAGFELVLTGIAIRWGGRLVLDVAMVRFSFALNGNIRLIFSQVGIYARAFTMFLSLVQITPLKLQMEMMDAHMAARHGVEVGFAHAQLGYCLGGCWVLNVEGLHLAMKTRRLPVLIVGGFLFPWFHWAKTCFAGVTNASQLIIGPMTMTLSVESQQWLPSIANAPFQFEGASVGNLEELVAAYSGQLSKQYITHLIYSLL